MFKSLLYKEWIKTRWFLVGYLLLALMAVGYIFLSVQHDFKFYEGKNYWNSILFLNLRYYVAFTYVPLIGGMILGVSQFFPETVEKRIKLSFHLPMKEDTILLQMMAYGTLTLLSCYAVLFATFLGLSAVFFPHEIILDAITSLIPSFLAGFAVYYLIGLIVLEPIWRFRLFYILVSGFLLTFYLKDAMAGAYAPMNGILVAMTIALSISLLFSGYRFRKGEQ